MASNKNVTYSIKLNITFAMHLTNDKIIQSNTSLIFSHEKHKPTGNIYPIKSKLVARETKQKQPSVNSCECQNI